MKNQRGEIVISTLVIICLLAWPINYAINYVAAQINPPPKIEIPMCQTQDGAVILILKDVPKE